MNIKGLVSNIIPMEPRGPEKTGRSIKSDQTHDRDANGQQAFEQKQEQQREPMTDEQLEKAMEHLRGLPATKENRWDIVLDRSELGCFVLVKDNLGTVIRRIPEKELWTLPDDQNSKGQLFKRSA